MTATNIHIESMGLLGSLLALNLDHRGVPFTWHDTDAEHVAWKASTGMVYPAGDPRSQAGLTAWLHWLHEGWLPEGAAEEVRYVYHHKAPPHDGKYRPEYDLGDMRVAPRQLPGGAVAVHAPRIVMHARMRFADRRLPAPPTTGHTLVRAHGFTERMGKTMWGWTVPVTLDVPADVTAACQGLRPSFYSRLNRFQIVYAYPIPGTDQWWSGSTLVGQTTPHHLDPEKHYANWLKAWTINFPRIPVATRGDAIEGWRPRPAIEPSDAALVLKDGAVLTFPPLWHSGIRWSPLVIRQALDLLEVPA